MGPVAKTGLRENNERLDRKKNESTHHGEQVRHTSDFCRNLRTENKAFEEAIQEFHQGKKTKEELKELFKNELKNVPEAKAKKMGLSAREESDIDTFLSKTGCFENQLMFQINADKAAKNRARESMIQDALDLAGDEYGNFDQSELKDLLEKEMNERPNRVKLFLESSKFRQSIIKQLPGSTALLTKGFGDINFDEITKKITNLAGTDTEKRREIQEAWLKITSIAKPEETLAEAFARITTEGAGNTALGGAYDAFFSDSNTLISRENREKILSFLTRQYIPIVPFDVVISVDPKAASRYIIQDTDKAIIESNTTEDKDLKKALVEEKTKEWIAVRAQALGNGTGLVSTRNLDFGTKIKLLSQFGSIGKAEQMTEYYRGKPGSLRNSMQEGEDYKDIFERIHGIEPAQVETKSGLMAELQAKLGKKLNGLEHFEDGCVMQWKTKNKEGETITGYYIIDTTPGDDIDDGNITSLRFLGTNKQPLSPAGLNMHYSGAEFYNYLAGCSEDGMIDFVSRDSFEETMKTNGEQNSLPRYISQAETYKELRQKFPEQVNIPDIESLNKEVDLILNPRGDNPLEAKNEKDRELHDGMVFVCEGSDGVQTFQIKSIDDESVTLWDGWGSGKNPAHEQTLGYVEFIQTIKQLKSSKTAFYRLNTNQHHLTPEVFNTVCANKDQYPGDREDFGGKLKNLRIQKNDGEYVFGKTNGETGAFEKLSIISIGEKKDIVIESIDADGTVRYRQGKFTQSKFDKAKGKITQKPEFRGTGIRSMSLSNLWAYLYSNQGFELTEPIEEYQKEVKDEGGGGMSWWNILMHTHSLGVILHGDLWKKPYEAWEEQHHKDHAFAGKMTAALAMEKLQSGGYPIVSSLWNWAEWPSLMVADGNGSFQSYLNELVDKIDGMGSYHRTRLIKKWSKKEHFPSVKFMAAMCASMQIFGHLYPYSFNDDYTLEHGGHKNPDWFWYNSICHSLDPNHKKYPHMPPHAGEPWPEKWIDKAGYQMSETAVCMELFGKFQHPMLKNLGRRFQKYMNGGQEHLQDGGKGNLEQRPTMIEKRDWMMSALCSATGKLPEGFGEATELWLTEGYPVADTSMPYAALLLSGRDKLLMPPTREHIRKQFQSGYHMPLFAFMQQQDHGELFRQASIAFAYTISLECGEKLEALVSQSSQGRLQGDGLKKWTSKFESFWSDYGKEIMYKIAGMKDPTLQMIVNEPAVYDELLDAQPPEKRAMYDKVRERKDVLRAFQKRIADIYDSPSHVHSPREKGYYDGDHFRFRDQFGSGYGGIPWYNWDAYIDSNLDNRYATGDATAGDGVFNEFRAFLYAIPKMAEKMVDEMGYTDPGQRKKFIDKIARSLHEKTLSGVSRLMKQKIDATNPKLEYCSMTCMMFGIIPVQRLGKQSNSQEENERFGKYFDQMKTCFEKAEEMQKTDYTAAMEYRQKMAGKWSVIVKGEINTSKCSLEDIENTDDLEELGSTKKVQENIQSRSGEILAQDREEFESIARNPEKNQTYGRNISPTNGSSHRNQNHREEEIGLSA